MSKHAEDYIGSGERPAFNDFPHTYNEDEELQSFNDVPMLLNLEPDLYFEWYHKDIYHRDNDKPAFVSLKGDEKIWYILDSAHREKGPQTITPSGKEIYSLFGINVPKYRFERILKEAKDRGVPLWAIWLLDYGLITEEKLNVSLDENKSWLAIPYDMLFKVWGIDNKSYRKHFKSQEFFTEFYDVVVYIENGYRVPVNWTQNIG